MDKQLTKIAMDLIALESEAPPGREGRTGDYIFHFLEDAGLDPRRQYCSADRFNVTAELGRGEEGGLKVLYCGHMDVVPAGDAALWITPPYEPDIREGRLYGRGACDMKGSLACALYAAKELAARSGEFPGKLMFLFDVDEEHQNKGLYRYLEDAPKIDFAVVGEPTNMEVALGHRGVMAFEITFTGKSAHAARPEEGLNAIYAAERFISKIREIQDKAKGGPAAGAMQVTVIRGGTKVNMIPQDCNLQMDCRLGPGESVEGTEEMIDRILQEISENTGCSCGLRILTSCPAGWCSPDTPPLLAVEEVLREYRGEAPGNTVFGASCEAGMLQKYLGIPAIILGPGSIRQAHITDEYITLAQLEDGAEIYTRIFEKMLTESGGEYVNAGRSGKLCASQSLLLVTE